MALDFAHANLATWIFRISSMTLALTCLTSAYAQTFTRVDTSVIARAGGYSQGGSWGDYDNDGDQDLLVSNGSRAPGNHTPFLFRNEGGWRFTQITTGNIVSDGHGVCSWGDYDNDFDLDLFCAASGTINTPNRLYRNEGDGTFTRDTAGPISSDDGDSVSSSWADIDNDGFLDLYVVNDLSEVNFLYHNEGNGTFTKVTGPPVTERARNDLASSWADFDDDGDLDLFVAVNGNDELYVNAGNSLFERTSSGDVVSDNSLSVAGAWADYDNDGDLDLYVTTYFKDFTGSAQKDLLYDNNGDGTFTKNTTAAMVAQARGTAGPCWGDLDNDGDLDLIVTTWGSETFLYMNEGAGIFTGVDLDPLTSSLSGPCSLADINRDGSLDVFIARGAIGAPFDDHLFANNGNDNSWIAIRLVGTSSNRAGIGAILMAKATVSGSPSWQMREVAQQNAYGGHSSLEAHFGFGSAVVIDSLVIRWPSGQLDIYTDISINQFVRAAEGLSLEEVSTPVEPRTLPTALVLHQNYPNPFNPATTITYSVPTLSHVTVSVFNPLGFRVETLISKTHSAGSYSIMWNSAGHASGVYFYQVDAGNYRATRKMLLVR